MLRASSVVVLLAGLWTAGAPWLGPLVGLGAMSGMGSAGMMGSMSAPAVTLSAQTLWYHVVPGGIAALMGLYQLVVPALGARVSHSAKSRSVATTTP